MNRKEIISRINEERQLQDMKWGYPQRNTLMEWGSIIAEEVGELCKELNDLEIGNRRGEHSAATYLQAVQRIKDEAIQVAAVAVSIVEHLQAGDEQ